MAQWLLSIRNITKAAALKIVRKELSENACSAHVTTTFTSHRPMRWSLRYQNSPQAS